MLKLRGAFSQNPRLQPLLDGTVKPNLVMGSNVQVCWEKFCRYWQVEPRYVPMVPGRLHLRGPEAAARCDENTIGVVAILDALGVPAVRVESLEYVLRPGHRRRPIELNVVVVVDVGELAQPKVASQRGRLRR